jgi:hypothetical protein
MKITGVYMELVKNRLSTTILKTSKYTQFTINDDFNVPDAKEDIEKIIASSGNVLLEDIDTLENKVRVSGTVIFKMLYQRTGDGGRLESYEGDIPFEETVNMDGIMPGDKVDVNCSLEDLYITMINSRKFEVRGLVGMKMWVMEQIGVDGATGIANGSGIECKYDSIPFTNNVANVRDIFKVREDVELAASKPNIGVILWDDVSFHGIETRVVDNGIHINGVVDLFVIYLPDEPQVPMQFISDSREFEGVIPCDDVGEGMILDENICVGKGQISVRGDADGEDRILQIDYNLNVDMKVYEDMELDIVGDMFSTSANIDTKRQAFPYENLQLKNNAKTKVVHKEHIKSSQPKVLQIIHVGGNVEVDDIKLDDNSIDVSGAVKAYILYVSSDDNRPVQQTEMVIPFTYQVEAARLVSQDSIRITPSLDNIAAQMSGADEIEVKAVINLNMTVFARSSVDVITDMEILPIDWEKKAAMPGIVGYIVKEGDSIWSIAKEYFSTLDSIRQTNELTSDDIQPGDRLIILKS